MTSSYTGSISANRTYLGLPPVYLEAIDDQAKLLGMRRPEFIRNIIVGKWFAALMAKRDS